MTEQRSAIDQRVDGRRRRKDEGRRAVLDATIDHVLEHRTPPTAEQIAERGGVSVASIFRYFDHLEDLRRAAIARFLERHDHLLDLPGIGEHSLARRITVLVDRRIEFYETIDPVARLARARAMEVPELATTLELMRATQTDQLSEHFATELRPLRPRTRQQLLALVAVLSSYEAWDLLRREGLDRDAVRRAMRTGISRAFPLVNGT